jgi:rieske iron-sulfur protein
MPDEQESAAGERRTPPEQAHHDHDGASEGRGCVCLHARRNVLTAALGAGLGLVLPKLAAAQSDARSLRPQDGDRFVFAGGERKGARIALADIPARATPINAYPQDPASGTVRDGSRLNQVILMRLPEAELAEATRKLAPQGIVAYSGVCTHAGCDTWAWQSDRATLKCPCHDSEFDVKDAARVTVGPATRRLPALPLRIVDGELVAAGSFIGRVGFQPA